MDFLKLEYGSTGNNVQLLQQMLKLLYLFPGTITGSFGPETTEAVKSFQARYGLPVTGVVDENTWNEIIVANQSFDRFKNDERQERPTIRLGSTGEYVVMLQRELNNLTYYDKDITGTFDVSTENAVKAFQANNKLIADGIVGRNTWNALTYLYSPLAICEDEIPLEEDFYIVKQGDTLYSIARIFNTTVDEIKRINNLTSNTLQIGQRLIIIKEEEDITGDEYLVQPGDTLYGIARKFNTTVDEIKRINNLTTNTLQINQVLKLKSNEDVEKINEYTVKQGDTLYSIARTFNTTVSEIKRINNLISDTLKIGQKLLINQLNDQEIYTVVSGDTIYSIARRFNTTIDNIKTNNNLTSNIISIGQVLRI